MSLEEFKNWNIDQVKARYKELKKESFDLRLKSGTGQLTDYSQVKKVRKQLAQLLTYAKQKGFKNIR